MGICAMYLTLLLLRYRRDNGCAPGCPVCGHRRHVIRQMIRVAP